MATTRSKKTEQLQALTDLFKNAAGVAFIRFGTATVAEVEAVRRSLREQGMTYTVIKKTLMALAAKNAGLADFSADNLEGMVAVITSAEDIVMPAQAVKKIKKDHFVKAKKSSKFDFAGAIFEGNFLDAKAAEQFADTPTKEESFGKIMGMLMVGPQRLHTVCMHGLKSFHAITKDAEKFAA